MGKGFKFRVSQVIPTFHSCRSKDPSTLPTNPVPSFLHHSSTSTTTKLNITTPLPHRFSLKRHVSSCGCLRSRASPEASHTKINPHHNYDSTPPRRKIYNSAASDTDLENDVVFLPPPPTKSRARKSRRRQRRLSFQKVRNSTSSDSGLFSEEERETLVSTDSAASSMSQRHRRHIIKSKERENNNNNKTRKSFDSGNTSPARLSAFMRKMAPCRAVADGKVRESFAVVKRSEDPYDDFRKSMVEMVVEKKMFEERELEELLRCFLSLNSKHHHETIVRAFTQIWETLFSQSPSPEY